MKTGKSGISEEHMKTAAIVAFALLVLGLLYYQLHDVFFPPTTAPAASAVSMEKPSAATGATPEEIESSAATPSASPIAKSFATRSPGATSAVLDPTLHMEAMLVTESLEYTGGGRNIFSASSAPVEIQKPLGPARPIVAAPPVVPCPPNCPPPPPPPPPPVVDLKFFGVETLSNGTRQAFLLHEDSVFLASVGDIVMRRYRVVAIEAKSIRIEDMQYKDTQTLPLLTN
jgi:hypothetical protein